ncbi:MAG: periplasmic sensory histidine protein kinase [Moraxellaceae bacterium]|nr:periplasmic sensory histidine protein kinase [Moraxellaceae bacterium]
MLKRSIAQTLFLVITLLALVVVLAMTGLFHVSLQHGFRTYVQSAELQRLAPLEALLLARHAEQGNWDFVAGQADIGRAVMPARGARSGPASAAGYGAAGWQGGPPPRGVGPPPAGSGPMPERFEPPPAGFGPRSEGFGPPSERFGPPAGDGYSYGPQHRDPPPGHYPPQRQGMAGDFSPGTDLPQEVRPAMTPGRFADPGGARPRQDVLSLGPRAALLGPDGVFLAGNRNAVRDPRRALWTGDGATRRLVGYLVLTEPPAAQRQAGEDFVAGQSRNLLWIALLALLLSALAAWGLARYFRRPISALATGTRRIASGDFGARLPETRGDELGRMAGDFNRMAEKLEAFEQSRRQWMADSSHELRTPLTVLATHLEAMRDGVIPTSPEKLQTLSRTVADMNRLVNDLFQLATTDAGAHDYRYEPVPVAGLLAELESSFAPRLASAKLALAVHDETPPGSCVRGDRLRLAQLLGNLLTNSSRYTDAGGKVRVTAQRHNDRIEIVVEDSAPGVPPASLPRLFDRFFRVDASRSRRSGGSGLGLAICRAIVQAHGGSITASASALGGLKVSLSLPVAKGQG